MLRTKTISEQRGFIKALVAKDSDEIVGFPAFGFEASELMVAMQTAMLAVMLLVLVSQTQQQSEVKMVKAAAYARDYPNRLDGHHPCPSNLELERQG